MDITPFSRNFQSRPRSLTPQIVAAQFFSDEALTSVKVPQIVPSAHPKKKKIYKKILEPAVVQLERKNSDPFYDGLKLIVCFFLHQMLFDKRGAY